MASSVIEIGRDWWKEEREPTKADTLVVQKKRKLSGKLYSVREVAELLSVSVDVVYDHIKEGNLHAWAVGRQWRIGQDAIEDFLALSLRKKGIA